jgi:hypothetical protein
LHGRHRPASVEPRDMPEFHAEPYIYLPAISHRSALVAWGAFYFKVKSHGETKLIKPEDLKHIHPPREDTIGARSAPYGPARIEVRNTAGETVTVAFTDITNHCWVTGLEPDTEYTYTVTVKGEQWAEGERWNWSAAEKGLVHGGRYENRFRTNPVPANPATSLTFAVIGDFGVGVKEVSREQRLANTVSLDVSRHTNSLADGINYFVSGAAAKLRPATPDQFEKAQTRSWSDQCHFLLVQIAGSQMTVRAIGELDANRALIDIPRLDARGRPVTDAMVIHLTSSI